MSRRVIETLRRHGHKAWWVGGCVRDSLLGRPIKDRDVATSARPREVTAIFGRTRLVGRRFGVVAVHDSGTFTEVATFRRDSQSSDGRRPDRVIYTTDEREDVLRRDFTINGMLLGPGDPRPIDHVDGIQDIERGLVRAIGVPEERFLEDHLRMLRAVRFAAGLGFRIEPKTCDAIRRLAHLTARVAAERVRDELSRILTEGGARRGFELLGETGMLRHLLPEIEALKGVEQPPEFHPEGDVWTHTLIMLEGLDGPSVPLAWGVVLHDAGKPDTFRRADRIRFHGHVKRGVAVAEAVCRRLRFSNADRTRVTALVRDHMKFMHVRDMRPGRLRRFVGQPHFGEHLELHRLDCLSSHGHLQNHAFALAEMKRIQGERRWIPLLTGHDLIAAGYEPGPRFGEILRAVEDRHLEGTLAGKQEALDFVLRRYPLARERRAASRRSSP